MGVVVAAVSKPACVVYLCMRFPWFVAFKLQSAGLAVGHSRPAVELWFSGLAAFGAFVFMSSQNKRAVRLNVCVASLLGVCVIFCRR